MHLFSRQGKPDPTRSSVHRMGASDVVDRYPGLAMMVSADGDISATSEAMRPLVAEGAAGDWWDQLCTWLTRPTGHDGSSTVLPMQTDNGPAIIEWTAVALADNTVGLFGRDVTLDANLRDALVESRQRFRDLVDISSDFTWETGADGRFVYVSPEGAFGYAAESLVGQDPETLLKNCDAGIRSPFQTRRAVNRAELWLRRSNGEDACVVAWARPLQNGSGEWRGARGLCREVTEARSREAALARARTREKLLEHIVRTMRDKVEPDRMLAIAARAIAKATVADGCRLYRQDVRGSLRVAAEYGVVAAEVDVAGFLAGASAEESAGAAAVSTGDGHGLAIAARSRDGADGAVLIWRSNGREPWNDDDRRLIEAVGDQIGVAYLHTAYLERLKIQAECDGMTKLLNRRSIFERLTALFDLPDGGGGVLLYIDINNFKSVNDVFGHQRGDAVLMEVTTLLCETTKPLDLRGRIGGDEFVIWLADADRARGEAVAHAMAERGRALAAHSPAPDRPAGLSIGAAIRTPGSDESVDEVIERADQAMYRAKTSRRDSGGGWALSEEDAS